MSIYAGAWALLLAGAESVETPATPDFRPPPAYPASCAAVAGEMARVVVVFDVMKDGGTKNARVRESSNACFDEAALAAVRGWRYNPRTIGGDPEPQQDLETTFSFVANESTGVEDFDARPFVRVPPEYPDRCINMAGESERVFVEFDVSAEGMTENVRVVESTLPCLDKSATQAVAKWRYHPRVERGEAVARKAVQTTITYQLADRHSVGRTYIIGDIMQAQRYLKKKRPDAAKALAQLAEIETKYGDKFDFHELSAFHQVRGAARLAAEDYPGALDDFRRVRLAGADSTEAIAEMIAKLEAFLAHQAAAPPPAVATASEAAGEAEPR